MENIRLRPYLKNSIAMATMSLILVACSPKKEIKNSFDETGQKSDCGCIVTYSGEIDLNNALVINVELTQEECLKIIKEVKGGDAEKEVRQAIKDKGEGGVEVNILENGELLTLDFPPCIETIQPKTIQPYKKTIKDMQSPEF